MTVSPARSGRVWAIVDAAEGGIYRSDDGGATWTWLTDDRNFLVRPWYFGHVLADPVDPDGLFVINRKLWRSGDGGRTYRQLNVPYVDEMDLWVDPREPRRMILGNDGGAAVSFDAGETWSSIVNQPTAEIYRIAADTHFPYRIYGSQQDNSTIALPSRSERGAISAMDWYDVGGGESGFIAVRPDNPNIVYSSDLPGLGVTRYDHATRQIREIGPWGEAGGDEQGALRYRFNWSVPVVLSPHDPGVLYIAGNVLFRTRDEGASWEIVSPDLTRNDQEKVSKARPGTHAMGENEGNHYCTICVVCRVTEDARCPLGRFGRRPGPRFLGRRRHVGKRHARRGACVVDRPRRAVSRTTIRSPTWRLPRMGWTISARTSSGRATAVNPGRRSRGGCQRTSSSV